jgi:hypothetical protein
VLACASTLAATARRRPGSLISRGSVDGVTVSTTRHLHAIDARLRTPTDGRYFGGGSSSSIASASDKSSMRLKSMSVGTWISPGVKSRPDKNLETRALPGATRRGPRQLFFSNSLARRPPTPKGRNFWRTFSDTGAVVSSPGTKGARTTAISSLPSPWLQESRLNLSWSLKMSGRPQVPNLFVGGPLRGPPPPRGWNFFIFCVRGGCAGVLEVLRAWRGGCLGGARCNDVPRRIGDSSAGTKPQRARIHSGAAGVSEHCYDALVRLQRPCASRTQRRGAEAKWSVRDGSRLLDFCPSSGAASDQSLRCSGRLCGPEDESCCRRACSHIW